MLYRQLDNNGDYSFGKNMQNFIIDAEAVAQAVKTRLLLLKEEWWEDTGEGLPLFQSILGQSGTEEHLVAADLLIRERIIGTTGVANIASFNRTYENRQYAISCTITTTTGQTATVEVTF